MQRNRILGVVSTLAVLALLYVQAMDQARFASRRVGFSISLTETNRIEVSEVAEGLPAAFAGLQVGDLVIGVGDREIEEDADYWQASEEFVRGQPVTFRVLRQGEEHSLTVVPGTAPEWRQFLTNSVAALAHLLLALVVLLQGRWDPRGRLLVLFALAVAVEFSLPFGNSNFSLQIFSSAFFFLLTGVQFALELHLAASIPDRHPWLGRGRTKLALLYGLGPGLGLAAALATILEGYGSPVVPWSSELVTELLFTWGLPVWALLLVALLGSQARSYPRSEGRSQALLVLMGVSPWVVYALVTSLLSLLDPAWTEPDLLTLLFPLVMLSYPVAVFVAIYRYHLFDIELVVRRSLVYGTLTTTLLLLFYALLGAGGALFSQWVDQEGHSVWVIALATLVLGLIFAPLRRWVQDVIDHRFFPERREQRGRLIDLASELPALGQLPAMGRHVTRRVDEIFGVRSSTILLADAATGVLATLASSAATGGSELDYSFLLAPEDPGVQMLHREGRPVGAGALSEESPYLRTRLLALDARLAVPITHHENLIGLLLLGARADGRELRGEELELLSLLAHHVASVFENARLFESATYESLTGLLRREKILEQLEREVLRARRYRRPMTVGMADLDDFKRLNDTYGHLAGDTVLKWVAQVLATEVRSTDVVGRYGGEEFLLLLPETDLEGGVVVAEKLREAVAETTIPVGGEKGIEVTLSIGLATLEKREVDESASPRELLHAADQALYRAKREGKNRVVPSLSEDGHLP